MRAVPIKKADAPQRLAAVVSIWTDLGVLNMASCGSLKDTPHDFKINNTVLSPDMNSELGGR